jgi:hypothetical protein
MAKKFPTGKEALAAIKQRISLHGKRMSLFGFCMILISFGVVERRDITHRRYTYLAKMREVRECMNFKFTFPQAQYM